MQSSCHETSTSCDNQDHSSLMKWLDVQSVEETGVGVSWSKTGLPQGEYVSSWGQDGTREVAKQFAGEFTLKSGGQVSAHTSCRPPPMPRAPEAGTMPHLSKPVSCVPLIYLRLARNHCHRRLGQSW